MKKNLLPLTIPGEVLNEEFLIAFGLSQYRLAKDLGIPARRINQIVHGTRAITTDTALRLGKYFGFSAQFWLNLQTRYDLQVAERGSGFSCRGQAPRRLTQKLAPPGVSGAKSPVLLHSRDETLHRNHHPQFSICG